MPVIEKTGSVLPGLKARLWRRGEPAFSEELGWVDGFIDSIRPYVAVRAEDRVLIRMPNQAHHLNETGVRVLGFLLEGGTASGLLRRAGAGRAREIGLFLHEVKRCLEGTLRENDHSCAVEVRPLDISFSSLPVLSEMSLTSRCNLRCVFCYAGCSCGAGGGAGKAELDTEAVMKVIDRIAGEARVPSVSFTGGEPTLRADLPGLVRYARGKGMRVNLITNGTLMTPSLAEALAEAGLASAQVSLEGVNAGTHDAVTGVAGSFERTAAAVTFLKDAGVHVHTNTTINRMNLGEAADIPGFTAGTLGLDRFSMNLVIPSGSAVMNAQNLVRYTEVTPVLEEVMDASARAGVEFMWYSPTPLCIFNPIIHGLGNKGCSACDGLLSVDCNGDVLPCSSCDDPVGNLYEEGFGQVWETGQAAAYRFKRMAPPGCRACDNFAVCHGACPLYWRHFGFGELSRRNGFPPGTGLPSPRVQGFPAGRRGASAGNIVRSS